ncbi:MAG TPA: cytochrome c3 family protein [Anaerolineales bacterium]|nr:cytochrome c3 family protein [Anaerolineales bacterium]
MNKRYGFLSASGLIASLVTLAAITILVILNGYELFSPGPLNAKAGPPLGGVTSHAEIGGECSRCHTTPWQAIGMSDQCILCHVEVNEERMDESTLHGAIYQNNLEITCQTCHLEHKGPDSPITNLRGIKFPHDSYGFSLQSHKGNIFGVDAECTDCHEDDFLHVDPITCGKCHTLIDSKFTSSHVLTFGAECMDCHDGLETYGRKFDHQSMQFPLEGQHAEVDCSGCHVLQFSILELQTTSQSCVACHQEVDKHLGNLGDNCDICHSPEDWKTIDFDHDTSAFKLEGNHAVTQCDGCHKMGVLKGTPSNCIDCHFADDKHEGSFGSNCQDCHTSENWKPYRFDHGVVNYEISGQHMEVPCEKCHINNDYYSASRECNSCHAKIDPHLGSLGLLCENCHTTNGWLPTSFVHNQSTFKLTGKHLSISCTDCHISSVYSHTRKTCDDCHSVDDKHKGALGVNCDLCHTTSSWKGATYDHSKTNFPLTGSHINVACQNCHTNGSYKGTPYTCISCHVSDDKHNGSFGTDCGTCHTTSTWTGATFDHSQTAFTLTGAHVNTTCSACHKNGVYKGTPTTCNACHVSDDKHNGSFGTDCGTCHTTSTWTGATFDHNKTAFTLTGAHVGVNCSACHKNGVYKGTPTTCNACHASDDKHNGSFGTDCGTCHTTSTWTGATFDHNNTAFKLTGAHVQVNCNACHVNGVYKGTPTTCYACHRTDDQHNGSFGTNCDSCHTTSTWSGATIDHDQFSFKLTGKHREVSCSGCHVNGVYQGTPTECESCHKPPIEHDGGLSTNCDQCHTTQNWDAD